MRSYSHTFVLSLPSYLSSKPKQPSIPSNRSRTIPSQHSSIIAHNNLNVPPFHPITVRARNPNLVVLFTLLSLHCLFTLLSSSSSSSTHSYFIQPCEAVISNENSNHRADTPSYENFPKLEGADFNYTQQTPLGSIEDPREFANGALSTQKLIAAPIIPINRQSWTGVDTRTAYFGNNFGGDKISKVPELLQAGMRQLIIDLWWDGAGVGWQLCPRVNRDVGPLASIRQTFEQEQKDLDASLHLQGMGNNQVLSQELPQPYSPLISHYKPEHSMHKHRNQSHHRINNNPGQDEPEQHDKKDFVKRGISETVIDHQQQQQQQQQNQQHNRKNKNNKKDSKPKADRQNLPSKGPRKNEWFKKKRPQRHAIKPKGVAAEQARRIKDDSKLASSLKSDQEHKGGIHRLVLNKGRVSSYDVSNSFDQTVDGITCSTGEDIVMLLQGIQTWIQQTSDPKFQDILSIMLNLNEIGNNSLGSRPPSNNDTVSGIIVNDTSVPVSNDEFFGSLSSPNTNPILKALVPNIVSLKDLFVDAFPSLVYSPTHLEADRSDLMATWWKNSRVGLDYYNTTTDPNTGKLTAPTGWPTSSYLTDTIKRRIIVGIRSINLSSNTTYNVTDDFTTLYAPGALGPSMTNSSLIKFTSSLDLNSCSTPMPGIEMVPTGTEISNHENITRNEDTEGPSKVSWTFSSMSDADSLPWTYSSGQLATSCGFSTLTEGRTQTLSFAEQSAMTIWSWDMGQPPLSQIRSRDKRCGVMQSNGRWAVQNCNSRLPVACRQIDTSGNWIIYDKGAANYRDVTCPPNYKFDVPRTANENRLLYLALLSYWNATSPAALSTFLRSQSQIQNKLAIPILPRSFIPEPLSSSSSDKEMSEHRRYRRKYDDDDYDDYEDDYEDDYYDEDEEEYDENGKDKDDDKDHKPKHHHQSPDSKSKKPEPKNNKAKGEEIHRGNVKALDPAITIAALPNGGMIWIDISSWQTAGCWVPGGTQGICPYQSPDHTAALQNIVRVSTIGGVIILVLLAIFLYLKCRRNVRIRKSNKRRAAVRNKIMLYEVETVPA
ncbi:hypothetical protein BGZ76_011364 [Entomortierella beljakovae]|nr:hypothetical protein BGZ76_011364 [Entomortierella beljakovae]